LVQRLSSDDISEITRVMEKVKPEGITCANDRTVGHVMHSLITLNYRIPKDVRIVGIGDVQYANLLPVPLTTVHQPCREKGVAAAAAMLERVAMPDMPTRDILLDCRLVVRDSAGRILAQANRLPLTGLLQLAPFSFRTIKYWSGFAGNF
jgi:GntR family transcriptional regulator, arabinose operon transcriptional repressor